MYDIIGDIHGHYRELVKLLHKLGYRKVNGTYRHPERKVIFVGDFVDRGPGVREVLHTAREMVANGDAYAVMGNHEYNAICYHTRDGNGAHLRPHSQKNYNQHKATLEAFYNHPREWDDFIAWFKELPLFLDLQDIRVVHASWVPSNVKWVQQRFTNHVPDEDFYVESSYKEYAAFDVVENLLKGLELQLPPGQFIYDKEGKKRDSIRIKWWITPHEGMTYQEIAMKPAENINSLKVPGNELNHIEPYSTKAKPVFTGHYWLIGQPSALRNNIACLDYSVAKGGKLAAYRWQGEQQLRDDHFVFVPSEANTDFP